MSGFAKETVHFETPVEFETSFPVRKKLPYFPYQKQRNCPLATIPEMVSFGEQDILAHQFVNYNDNYSQEPQEVYYRNVKQEEPYTTSLYQTPYDQTSNLISTGTMMNPYTGEISEVFENQLPPPNTNKGVLLQRTLEHVNPRLVQLNGGYDPNNPPPARIEHINDEMSNRNGSDVKIDEEIIKNQRSIVSRDLYNNQDGNFNTQADIGREQPWGYKGFQPMYEFTPFLPNTQELDLKERTVGADPIATDLTKREDYQGEFFARKNHVLITREAKPTNFINDIEAVSLIPIASEAINKQSNIQTYLTPAFHDSANLVIPQQNNMRHGHEINTNPINHLHHENIISSTIVPTDKDIRQKINSNQTNPSTGFHGNTNGDLIINTNPLNGKQNHTLPITGSEIPIGNIVKSQHSINKPTNNNNNLTMPSGQLHLEHNSAGLLLPNELKQIKESLGLLPIANPEFTNGNVFISNDNFVPTKIALPTLPVGKITNETGTLVVNSNLNVHKSSPKTLTQGNFDTFQSFGQVLVNQKRIETSKTQEILPVNHIHNEKEGQILHANIEETSKKTNQTTLPINQGHFDQNSNVLKVPVEQYSSNRIPNLITLPINAGHLDSNSNIVLSQHQLKKLNQNVAAKIGEAHLEQSGNVVLSQTNIRNTSNHLLLPTPSLQNPNQNTSYVQLNTTTKDTRRMFNPIHSYVSAPTTNLGGNIGLSNHQINQFRGTKQNNYITSTSRVPIDAGMQPKVIGLTRFDNKKSLGSSFNYLNHKDQTHCPSPKISSNTRLKQEYQDQILD